MSTPTAGNTKGPTSDADFYLDITKFEVQAIAQRNQILLLFNSILFTVTAISAGKEIVFLPMWLVMSLGILVSIVFLYLNALTQAVESLAMEKLIDKDLRVKELLEEARKPRLLKMGSVSKLMAFFFPLLMLLCWVVLLILYHCLA